MERKRIGIVVGILVLLSILIWNAKKIPFYTVEEVSLEEYSFEAKTGEKGTTDNQILWFSCKNHHIVLNTSLLLNPNDVSSFGLIGDENEERKNKDKGSKTDESTRKLVELKEEDLDKLDGTFYALASVPVTLEGENKEITVVAKLDTEVADKPEVVPSQQIPMDVILEEGTAFVLYFNGQPYKEQPVQIFTSDGTRTEYKTDQNGKIEGIAPRECYQGITILLGQEGHDYLFSYLKEETEIGVANWFRSMAPLIQSVVIALVVICLLILILNRKKSGTKKKCQRKGGRKKSENVKVRISFQMIRWGVMIISLFLLTFGTRIFGVRLSSIELPIFACPRFSDQSVGSQCIQLRNLQGLFETKDWIEIGSFFGGLILALLLLGRTICGFLCPMGLLQDIVYKIRCAFHIETKAFDEKGYQMLHIIKWFLVLIMLGGSYLGIGFCGICPALGLTRWVAGVSVGIGLGGVFLTLIIIGSFFKERFFCNICPLGCINGLLSKYSIIRLKKDCTACTECSACYEACPMGIKQIYTEREKSDITHSNCIMCGKCVKKCPEKGALAISIFNKKIYISSRSRFFSKNCKEGKGCQRKEEEK